MKLKKLCLNKKTVANLADAEMKRQYGKLDLVKTGWEGGTCPDSCECTVNYGCTVGCPTAGCGTDFVTCPGCNYGNT